MSTWSSRVLLPCIETDAQDKPPGTSQPSKPAQYPRARARRFVNVSLAIVLKREIPCIPHPEKRWISTRHKMFKISPKNGERFKPRLLQLQKKYETKMKPSGRKHHNLFKSPTVSNLINRCPQPPRPLSPTCSSRPLPPSLGARHSRGTTYLLLSPRARGWTRPPRPTRHCEPKGNKTHMYHTSSRTHKQMERVVLGLSCG